MLQHDNYAFNTYTPCSNTIIMLLTFYAMIQHDNYALGHAPTR